MIKKKRLALLIFVTVSWFLVWEDIVVNEQYYFGEIPATEIITTSGSDGGVIQHKMQSAHGVEMIVLRAWFWRIPLTSVTFNDSPLYAILEYSPINLLLGTAQHYSLGQMHVLFLIVMIFLVKIWTVRTEVRGIGLQSTIDEQS